MEGGPEKWKAAVVLICGSLVYYHCAYRNSSLVSLISDVFIVLLCSLAILGMLFRQLNISVPVDPLEWQISQDTANGFAACMANTIGAAESVLRVAATGHDKRLFIKGVIFGQDLTLPRNFLQVERYFPATGSVCFCKCWRSMYLHGFQSGFSTKIRSNQTPMRAMTMLAQGFCFT